MTTKNDRKRGALRAPFRIRNFRLLLSSIAISATGDWLYGVALLVYLYDHTHSAGWIAVANIVRFLPYVLFSALGGVIADRYDRRRLMITIDTMRGLLMVALAIVAAKNGGPALVVVFAAAATLVNTAYRPCVPAAIPSVVGEDDLTAANAVLAIVENVALAFGPAVGGILLLLGSPTLAFVGNAASFFISALLIARVRTPLQAPQTGDEEDAATPSVATRIAQGFQAIRSNATAAVLVTFTVALTFAWGFQLVLFPLVATRLLHTSDGLAFMFAAIGIGGVAAAGLTSRASRSTRPAAVIVIAGAISAVPIVLLAFVHQPLLAYALLAIEGAATVVAEVITMTMLQRVISGAVLGRVMGILDTLAVGGILLGSLLAPILVSAAGLQTALIVGGVLVLILTLLVLPRARAIDRAAVEAAAELAARIALLSSAEMFEAAAPATIEALAASLVAEHVATGTAVVREGDAPDDMWLIAAGELEVTAVGTAGSDAIAIDHLGPGDYFGEIGLLHGVPRNATVTTTSDADLWRLTGEDFLRIISQGTRVSASLQEGVTARVARVPRAATTE